MGLQGAIAAIITPFTPDGAEIVESELRAHIDRMIDSGADGVLAAAGTGEFNSLSVEERQRVIRITVDQTAGRVPVVAQTGAMTTAGAIAATQFAADAGVDAVMVAPPFAEALAKERIHEYYAGVAKASPVPVMIYHYPPGTHVTMTAEEIVALAEEFPSIQYVKDSSMDPFLMSKLVTESDATIGYFVGEEVLIPGALVLGARGLVSGGFNFLMPAYARMVAMARAGDYQGVAELWKELSPFTVCLANMPYVAGVKAVCEILGHPVGPVRAPQNVITADDRRSLEAAVRALPAAHFS
jgi:4-hydroxy-tetrahydrodipicolinate synthase